MPHALKFDVNCSILLTELPIAERAAAAHAAGFDAVEFWWPFADPVPSDREASAFIRQIRDAGVELAGLNFFAGDMGGGDRGIVSWPGRSKEFRDNVAAAVAIGAELGCTAFNALYGNRVDDATPEQQDDIAVENLSFAARAADAIGAQVLLEPVSGAPRYPLTTAADALDVIARVQQKAGADNVVLLADLYHLAMNGDDVRETITAHAGQIGHVQIADAPGRHEPGTGSLPLDDWLELLEQSGYRGWVGLEYVGRKDEPDCFAWLPPGRR